MSIRVGIFGYGNLGKGVECAVKQNDDFSLVGVFTRRSPESVKTLYNTPVYSADDVLKFKGEIDVLIICGGSATDLPKQTPQLSKHFNVVDRAFSTNSLYICVMNKVTKRCRVKRSSGTIINTAFGSSSMFTISKSFSLVRDKIPSSRGTTIRQGPHQGAQKSSSTGLSVFRTSS